MTAEARRAGVPVRRTHLVVAIDRLLARLLDGPPPGSWVVKGGYANQLRRPDEARFTEDLDLKIEATIEEATGLGLLHFADESASQTIAEGVETAEELAMLRELGVPLAQGYLLARPAPVGEWVQPAGN